MAFDALASDYDRVFTDMQIARWLRERVHARLNTHFIPGQRVLELGCGTGEDARHLAAQGVRVVATDASSKMLEVAAHKNAHTPLVTFAPLNLLMLPEDEATFNTSFDGVFSNFGALNCISDWQPLAVWLAQRVKPGGKLGFGIMSPFCLWEIAWHGLHLNFRTATRRLRHATRFKLTETIEMQIYYPAPRQIAKDFAPYFKWTHTEGLALVLPPSEVYPVIEKRPRLLRVMTSIDGRVSRVKPFARFADHYWIEFERTTQPAPSVYSGSIVGRSAATAG